MVADEVPEPEVPTTPSPTPPAGESAFFAWLKHPYLPHAQAIVGLLAGILSIGGFVYSYMWATTALPPNSGELIAVALDARTEKPIPNATLEVLTSKDALVTTLTPDANGRARQTIKATICSFYHPIPHPYYDFLLREQGFGRAADACAKHVARGYTQAAMEQPAQA